MPLPLLSKMRGLVLLWIWGIDNVVVVWIIVSVMVFIWTSYVWRGFWLHPLLLQTSFSLYLHNQWTNFHKLSCTGKPQMRAIRTYVGGTKATTNNWDIRISVAVKASSANISWTAEQIRTIKLALGSAYQFASNDIWCISKRQVLVEIQAYQCSDIISYLLKLAW